MLLIDVAIMLVIAGYDTNGQLVGVKEFPRATMQECMKTKPKDKIRADGNRLVYVCAAMGKTDKAYHEEIK